VDEAAKRIAGKLDFAGTSAVELGSSLDLAREPIWQLRRLKYACMPLIMLALAAVLSRLAPISALLAWGSAYAVMWFIDIIISEFVCRPALARGEGCRAFYGFALCQGVLGFILSSFAIWGPNNVPGGMAFVYALLLIIAITAIMAPIRSLSFFAAWAGPHIAILLFGPWLIGTPYAADVTMVNIVFLAYMCSLAMRFRDLRAANERLTLERAVSEVSLTRMQGALLDLQNRVSLAQTARQEFLVGLGDDMRIPVNSLLSASEALREELQDGPNERAQLQAHEIATGAAQLLDFADDLADLARLETGTLVVNSQRLDVPALLASVHEAVAPRLRDLQITMDVLAFADLPFLLADAHVVRRMAINLIANAMRGTEPGGRVSLAAFRLPDGGLGLRVSNSGLGLSESELEHVLESFVSGRLDRVSGEKPAGLALMIVRELAQLQGGSLSLGRRVGVGAYATVHFPPERLVAKRALVRLIEAA
jgi:signal transduction histidine kinase